MKLYIAGGPIKGNEKAFREAATYFEEEGHEVIVPLDIPPYSHKGIICPGNTSDAGESDEHKSGCFMRNDIIEMLKCDGIVLLEGWENSAGAKIEFLTAQACGLIIIFYPLW